MNATAVSAAPHSYREEISSELAARLSHEYREIIAPGMNMIVFPGMEISWDEFRNISPRFSIALDGLVGDAPLYDAQEVKANFNHHQNVNRLATRSTSGQVHMAIKAGLMDAFRENGIAQANIYVNDPDQDSSLAVWLITHHERLTGIRSEPLISKIVAVEDFIDSAAGGFPFDPRSVLMQELAWVFDPYVQARMAGRIRSMEGAEMSNVITAIGERIDRYTMGKAFCQELDTRYDIMGGGQSWKMIEEKGFYARAALFTQGIDAFVSFLGEENSRYHYSIGKRSPYIPFPIDELYAALNIAETVQPGAPRWGGGDTIGGSPRRIGSSFSPKDVEGIINEYIEQRTLRFT